MNFDGESDDITFDFPIVAGDTDKALEEHHNRASQDYATWKRGFLEWLVTEGKKPARLEGYSPSVVRQTSYKTDQIMRWLWGQRGYTTELTPDDADALMQYLGRHSPYGDGNLLNFVKTIKRIFAYHNTEKGADHDWECEYELDDGGVTNRDYFRKDEFRPLYEASLNHGAVKNYRSCSIEERDKLKAALAQRFEIPKEQVGPETFDRANTFKIPSIVSVSLDMGLRPVEVERATVDWVNLDNATLDIPKEESSKNEENWQCSLSRNSVRALDQWLDERESYEKYEYSNALWLNKKKNPYTSKSLNYLLDQLIEEAGIKAAGRALSWYSIRHGVATVWADEENIQHAQQQLRHKKVETTRGYAHSSAEVRQGQADTKW